MKDGALHASHSCIKHFEYLEQFCSDPVIRVAAKKGCVNAPFFMITRDRNVHFQHQVLFLQLFRKISNDLIIAEHVFHRMHQGAIRFLFQLSQP